MNPSLQFTAVRGSDPCFKLISEATFFTTHSGGQQTRCQATSTTYLGIIPGSRAAAASATTPASAFSDAAVAGGAPQDII